MQSSVRVTGYVPEGEDSLKPVIRVQMVPGSQDANDILLKMLMQRSDVLQVVYDTEERDHTQPANTKANIIRYSPKEGDEFRDGEKLFVLSEVKTVKGEATVEVTKKEFSFYYALLEVLNEANKVNIGVQYRLSNEPQSGPFVKIAVTQGDTVIIATGEKYKATRESENYHPEFTRATEKASIGLMQTLLGEALEQRRRKNLDKFAKQRPSVQLAVAIVETYNAFTDDKEKWLHIHSGSESGSVFVQLRNNQDIWFQTGADVRENDEDWDATEEAYKKLIVNISTFGLDRRMQAGEPGRV